MRRKKTIPLPPVPEASPAQPIKTIGSFETFQITSLEQLQEACDQIVHIKVVLPDRVVLIPIRLLRPNEFEQIELIHKEAHPPMKEVLQPDGRKELQYVPDIATLEKSAALQRVGRAMALWWACPLFQASERGKEILKMERDKQRPAIVEFVQSSFTETILDRLYAMARAEEFELDERVNFTSPSA